MGQHDAKRLGKKAERRGPWKVVLQRPTNQVIPGGIVYGYLQVVQGPVIVLKEQLSEICSSTQFGEVAAADV